MSPFLRTTTFAGLLALGTSACIRVPQVNANGVIADHPTERFLARPGADLQLCLDLEITSGGRARTTRVCERPRITSRGYRWSKGLSQSLEEGERVRVRGAELTYRSLERLADCTVREDAVEKWVTCTGVQTRNTYVVTGAIPSALSGDRDEVRVPLSWNLALAPTSAGTENKLVELPGRGIKNPRGQCLPMMGTTGGWLAADGGRSLALPDGRSIHLFGDTLVGPVNASDRRSNTFVGNSVGVGQCIGGEWKIRYVWRDDGVKREPIFDLKDGKTRVWPVDAFYLGTKLYVVLAKIVHVDTGIGFDYAGSVLGTVHNPLENPALWRIGYQPLTGIEQYRPSRGITVSGHYAYIYSHYETAYPHPGILLRLPLNGLAAAARSLQFLARGNQWLHVSQLTRENVQVIAPDTSPNMYVHHDPSLKKWTTVHAEPTFGSPNMILRTADRLEGPWSKGVVVYQFPEMLDPRLKHKSIICYAVTEHPQLRRGSTIVVTYACNTLEGPLPGPDELHLYYPKTVTIDLKKVPGL